MRIESLLKELEVEYGKLGQFSQSLPVTSLALTPSLKANDAQKSCGQVRSTTRLGEIFRSRKETEKRKTIFGLTSRKMTGEWKYKKEERKKEKERKKEREREEKEKKRKEKELEKERRKSTKKGIMTVSSPQKIDKIKRAFNVSLEEVRSSFSSFTLYTLG